VVAVRTLSNVQLSSHPLSAVATRNCAGWPIETTGVVVCVAEPDGDGLACYEWETTGWAVGLAPV